MLACQEFYGKKVITVDSKQVDNQRIMRVKIFKNLNRLNVFGNLHQMAA